MAFEILADLATFEVQRVKINDNFALVQTHMDNPLGQTYTLTAPAGGDLREFNPNTATTGQLMDVVATMLKDLKQ